MRSIDNRLRTSSIYQTVRPILKKLYKRSEPQESPHEHPSESPNCLFLEVTSACNFHCNFCPSDELQRTKCKLDYKSGEKFLRKAKELYGSLPVNFNVLGEPFANNEIFKYLDLCKELDMHSIIITNFALITEEMGKKLFSNYNNFTLVLSLQSTDDETFELRGIKNYTFSDYLNKMKQIIRWKYECKCSGIIEVHVATALYMLSCDNTITYDYDNLDPLGVLGGNDLYEPILDYLESIKDEIRSSFPDTYKMLDKKSVLENADDLRRGQKVLNRYQIPKDAQTLSEDRYWGFMAMPQVYFRYKIFGAFNRELNFVKKLFRVNDSDAHVFVDNATGSKGCGIANNIGVLSNGQLVLCCLDYEGEMKLGNINDIDISSADFKEIMHSFADNVLAHEMCRRCKGNIYITDRSALNESSQTVIHYSHDWHPLEDNIVGRPSRWSKSLSTAYVYTRLNGRSLSIDLQTKSKNFPLRVNIYLHDEISDSFNEVKTFTHYCRSKFETVTVDYEFAIGNFYKIELICPKEHDNNIGVCVYEMKVNS
jgi:hypothetical protein